MHAVYIYVCIAVFYVYAYMFLNVLVLESRLVKCIYVCRSLCPFIQFCIGSLQIFSDNKL